MNTRNELFDITDKLSEFLIISELKIQKSEFDDELKNLLNAFTDDFVSISKNETLEASDIRQAGNELADSLVEIIEHFNHEEFTDFYGVYFSRLTLAFEDWLYAVKKRLRYKIVVFGIDRFNIIPVIFNSSRAQVIAYADDDTNNLGKYVNGMEVVDLGKVPEEQFDYLLLMNNCTKTIVNSVNEGKIPYNKLFFFYRHYLIDSDYNFYNKYYEFMDSDKGYEAFVTGLSYAETGINAQQLKMRCMNFAVSSQDLFFDYHLFKYALGFSNFRNNMKYVIISLPYYSFQYDLSRSKNKRTIRAEIYYPILKTVHNYENGKDFEKEYKIYASVCNNIFKSDYSRIIFNTFKDYYEKIVFEARTKKFDCNLNESEKLRIIEDVNRDFNKNYPLTVEENKEILRDYLRLAKSNNIKPIIVVCPVTKIYAINRSERIYIEFYEIIKELKSEFEFQLIDCFNSELFEDNDFYDASHLNFKGAEKFTQLLNNIIEW